MVSPVFRGVLRYHLCFAVFRGVSRCFAVFCGVSRRFAAFRGVSRCFAASRDVSRCFVVLRGGRGCVVLRVGYICVWGYICVGIGERAEGGLRLVEFFWGLRAACSRVFIVGVRLR